MFTPSTSARLAALLFLLGNIAAPAQSTAHQTRNIIFVMTDGLRWQEVFKGADDALMNKANRVTDPEELKKVFWRDTPDARRQELMPFLWTVIAKQGQ